MANAIARSDVGKIMINKDKIKKMLSSYRLSDYLFTTTSIKKYIPIFENKLGKNMDLHLDLSFKYINVLFGQYDTHIILEYTVCLDFKRVNSGS